MIEQEVPEGRCMVCRAAWEPCRRCKGQELKRKCEETMARNGTRRSTMRRGEGLRFGPPPETFRHYQTRRDDDADA